MPRPFPPPTSLVGVPLAVRPGGHVQIGSSPRSGSVVGPLSGADLEALVRWARAPGSASTDVRRDGARVVADLVRGGALPAGRAASDVTHLLESAETSAWAPDAAAWSAYDPDGLPGGARLLARGRRSVAVVGCGRTGTALLGMLSDGGVGGLTAADDDPARAQAALARTGRQEHDGPTDLVVLVDHHAARADRADGLVADGVPHLSVVLRDTDALVGPLVVPGRTACLRCLDLHRSDADPEWPAVLDQFSQRPDGPAGLVVPEETATASLLAGLVALQVFSHLDGGDPPSVGATLELLLPEGLVQLRKWSPHPQCGCGDLPVPGPV